jgi:hypothetical protein
VAWGVVGIGAIRIRIPACYNMSAALVREGEWIEGDQTFEQGLPSDDIVVIDVIVIVYCLKVLVEERHTCNGNVHRVAEQHFSSTIVPLWRI